MRFSYLGGIVLVEKHWNRIAKCPERLRMQMFASLEGFHTYTNYGRVSVVPT